MNSMTRVREEKKCAKSLRAKVEELRGGCLLRFSARSVLKRKVSRLCIFRFFHSAFVFVSLVLRNESNKHKAATTKYCNFLLQENHVSFG